jgi:hypothetical protein
MDTYGWDTVFAVSLDSVNSSLARSFGAIPQNFSLSGTDFVAYQLQGSFESWQIIPGGSGQVLWMQLNIASGSYTLGTETGNLAGVAVQVEVSLQLIPATTPQASNLVFNLKAVGQAGQPLQPGLVTPLSTVLDPNHALNPDMVSTLPSLMATFLVNNASLVTYVFASIQPANSGPETWLTPQGSDYLYAQTDSGAGYLAILSVTSSQDISQLPRQIDPSILNSLQNAVFVISQDLFLRNVIMPVLPAAYGHGSTTQTFTYSNGAISNTQSIGLDGVQKGAITYYPEITSLSITVSGGSLNTSISGGCDLKMNMSMTFKISCSCPAAFNSANRTLFFLPDPAPQESHDSNIPWYDYLLGPIPDLIISLVVPAIASGIAGNLTSQLQNFALINSPPQSVQWAGLGPMEVQSAGLSTSFYLLGDLQQVSRATP